MMIKFKPFCNRCGEGQVMSSDSRTCTDRNECLELPCLNGGTCYNKQPPLRYTCVCSDNFYGDHCEFIREQQALKLSTSALASVVACLVVIISEYPYLNLSSSFFSLKIYLLSY